MGGNKNVSGHVWTPHFRHVRTCLDTRFSPLGRLTGIINFARTDEIYFCPPLVPSRARSYSYDHARTRVRRSQSLPPSLALLRPRAVHRAPERGRLARRRSHSRATQRRRSAQAAVRPPCVRVSYGIEHVAARAAAGATDRAGTEAAYMDVRLAFLHRGRPTSTRTAPVGATSRTTRSTTIA